MYAHTDAQHSCLLQESETSASTVQICNEIYLGSSLVSVAKGDVGVGLGAQGACRDCSQQHRVSEMRL